MYAPRGTFRSLEDQDVEHAVVRVNFRAFPSRPRLLTVCLWLVAPSMLDYWLPSYQLLIKSVKVSLRLISLRERVNVRANEIC